MEISHRLEGVSFATEPGHSTAVIGMAEIGAAAIGMVAIGITTTTITLIISFSSAALAFPSSAIRMAMDITLTAMVILPTVTGMDRDTTDMATATMATATTVMVITVTTTTAIASTAAVITRAIAPTEVDQALPVCSDNYPGPVTIVVQSTE